MKVVVIGSPGQLGQDLMRLFVPGVVGLTHQDVEIRDEAAVARTLRDIRPDWVLNTAAFHRVDDCEQNPSLAFAVNAIGAHHVARAAAAAGAGVVFFSTDYVFGSQTRGPRQPYDERDCPGPLNVYGISKLAGEHLVMTANRPHLVGRTTGLFAPSTTRNGTTLPPPMVR